MRRNSQPPSECPVCGADVPRNAKACPECGADERTGWNEEDTRYDGLDLPESAFEKEPLLQPRQKSAARGGWWIAVAVVLLIALTIAFVT